METALVIDTEVNGMDAMEVISLAYCGLDDGLEEFSGIEARMYKPEKPFEAGAVAVHGIIPDDVQDCPPSSGAADDLPAAQYIIGHNIDFDADALGISGQKRICTLALSRELWPDFKSHTLSAMTIELQGMTWGVVTQLRGAHNAIVDVELCCQLLRVIIGRLPCRTLAELYDFSEQARVPTRMPFGKHKGEPISQIPPDYKRWLLRQPDVCPYLQKALQVRG